MLLRALRADICLKCWPLMTAGIKVVDLALRGCTSEIISPNGLLLTNHHCGFGNIQSHSTVEHDYLKDGFWAMSYAEELPNENLSATFIKRIDDVTAQVFVGVTEDMDEASKMKIINQNILKVTKAAQKEEWQDANIKSFYKFVF